MSYGNDVKRLHAFMADMPSKPMPDSTNLCCHGENTRYFLIFTLAAWSNKQNDQRGRVFCSCGSSHSVAVIAWHGVCGNTVFSARVNRHYATIYFIACQKIAFCIGYLLRVWPRVNMAENILKNRMQAAVALADRLAGYVRHVDDAIVLGLPRGGVPIAFGIADVMQLPLDIMPVRKIGAPGYEEYAIGAIADGGQRVFQPAAIASFDIDSETIDLLALRESLELERRKDLYRARRPPPLLEGRTVILVDDGLATGCTMLAAIAAVREHYPARLIVAVPVGARDACAAIRAEADELVCLKIPEPFYSVSVWYEDFTQVTDDEVVNLLARASRRQLLQQADSDRHVIKEQENNEHAYRLK